MDTRQEEPSPNQGRENEEFILFMVEVLSMIGAMASIVIGYTNSDSSPNAPLIGLAGAILLFGFIFERGMISSQMPSSLRERIWWLGPVIFIGIIMLKQLIEGTLFPLTLDYIGFIVLFFIFWVIGAGLKRLLVRGRFEQAYRGKVSKTGEIKFHLNQRLLIGTIILVVILDLFAFLFDKEGFPSIFSASLIFLIFTNVCVPVISENSKTENTEIPEYDL